MKFERDLGVTQELAWVKLHCIREKMATGDFLLSRPLEVADTYIGSPENDKRPHKGVKALGGPVGKTNVPGVREMDLIATGVVPDVMSVTLTAVIAEHADTGAEVSSDGAMGCLPPTQMGNDYRAVKHSTAQYVDGMARTNGMGSFWAPMNFGLHGEYHQLGHEHLHQYGVEFQHRHSKQPRETIKQKGDMVSWMANKRLAHGDLVADGVNAKRKMGV